MSAEQTRRSLNQLDKEIADLENKLANEAKKEADKTKRIGDIQKSITKNTSVSTVQSKNKQILSYQSDLAKIVSDRADISKKIADKRKKRADTQLRLQKDEANEQKEADKKQKQIQVGYEKQIRDLNNRLQQQMIDDVRKQIAPKSLYDENSNGEEYDVFISHASEDKENFADELNAALVSKGIKVWYDTQCIKWGDSLRTKIDDGLRKSKYGIVILSQNYIQKGWTQYELDGLFQVEMTNGKTILPIWHNISKQEVQKFSPSLAGKLALNTTLMTPDEIADEMVSILGITLENEGNENNGQNENAQPE